MVDGGTSRLVCPQCVGTAHAGLSRACSSACPRHRTRDRARESCTVTTPSSLPSAQTAHERRGDLCNVCAQGSLPRATHTRARAANPSTCVFLPRHRSLPPPVRRSSCRRVRSLANMRRRTRLQAHPQWPRAGIVRAVTGRAQPAVINHAAPFLLGDVLKDPRGQLPRNLVHARVHQDLLVGRESCTARTAVHSAALSSRLNGEVQ
jgi:hypothetical protein